MKVVGVLKLLKIYNSSKIPWKIKIFGGLYQIIGCGGR
jgi:hypothetical protein